MRERCRLLTAPAMYIEHVYILFMLSLSVDCVNYDFPRGVRPNVATFYDPSKDFVCFDGLVTIPFSQVNDDYCDCNDGSDEPGTSACSNGWFHCMNSGYLETQIQTSRVNDGICDCCDGSDEYVSNQCQNTCSLLNEMARARAEARAKILREGNDMRLKLIEQAKQIRLQKEERLKKLEDERVEAEKLKDSAESQKRFAEEVEDAGLQVYRAQEEKARIAKLEKEKEEAWKEAHDAFVNLDSNQNNILDLEEIQVKQTFDQNKDGQVSNDEINWFLDLKDVEVNEEVFHNSVWPHVKPLYMIEKGLFLPPEPHQDEPLQNENLETPAEENLEKEDDSHYEEEPDTLDKQDDDDEEGNLGEQEADGGQTGEGEVTPEHKESTEPVYDAFTTRLIEEANEARTQFNSAQEALQNIEREMQQIKEKLDMDYGPEDEYSPLDGQCFTFTDREYTYKLCPFNQVTQAPKSGGSETRLGSWSSWSTAGDGPAMIYDKGQSCWNGPQRSTKVFVECGSENVLYNVVEPNKCEYQMHFKTPAACKLATDEDKLGHDEL
uniref:Glucosidase 2 subunit beta n=1 Tax=Lygus hesperus TaxID=30085 RepID=A0A0K8T5A3_LYGHE